SCTTRTSISPTTAPPRSGARSLPLPRRERVGVRGKLAPTPEAGSHHRKVTCQRSQSRRTGKENQKLVPLGSIMYKCSNHQDANQASRSNFRDADSVRSKCARLESGLILRLYHRRRNFW